VSDNKRYESGEGKLQSDDVSLESFVVRKEAASERRMRDIFVVNNPNNESAPEGRHGRGAEYATPTELGKWLAVVLQRCRTYGAA
jgi:hypothetical protein